MARILGHRIFDMSHTVKTFFVHMPGKEKVVFRDGHEQAARPIQDPLNAYFQLNEALHEAGDTSADGVIYTSSTRLPLFLIPLSFYSHVYLITQLH